MNLAHLTASTFYGGPERQMLGLAHALPEEVRTTFLSFPEGGRSRTFLGVVRQHGFEAVQLVHDTPWFRASVREIVEQLDRVQADVLLCHGYKANILGRAAARRLQIPVLAVSRGWTAESFRVRWYERLDRLHLRFLDHVVAVSGAQAEKVRRCFVGRDRIRVIPNAIDPDRFLDPDPRYRAKLDRFFRAPPSRIIGAAGRLSPEKGFDVLICAAARVIEQDPDVGFVIFGDGPCKQALQELICQMGLAGSVVFAGFRNDLDRFIPQLDLFVLSSFTEGMPNVVLESCAAGVPVIATAVGGTPEILQDGVSGVLVPPGNPITLADRIIDLLASDERMREMGFQARQRVLEQFSFTAQAEAYLDLFAEMFGQGETPATDAPVEQTLAPEPTCERR